MRAFLLIFSLFCFLLVACNPTYLPVPATGIATPEEIEIGAYGSFGYLGRKVRPTTFRGLVANFGFFFRKGIYDSIDWTMTAGTYGVTTAFGFRQDRDAETVLRARFGLGWMNVMTGVDWATRVSEGPRTDYAAGGTAMAWVGDAFWTDDPGLSYGLRIGALGQIAAEPRWGAPVSGGIRLDWAPLQFGGRGADETIVDWIGGTRNPYAEPIDEGILHGWPPPRLAFEPGAWVITGGPAITYHRNKGNWSQGGEDRQK